MKHLLTLLALTLSFSSTAAELKVAIVDLAKIFQQSPEREAIQQKLNDEFKDVVDDLKKKEKSIKDLEAKLQRDKLTMSMKESQEIARQREEIGLSLRMQGKRYQEDLRRREGEETRKMMTNIQKAINQVSKAKKFDLVFRRETLTYFSSKAIDITADVVKALK